MYISSKTKTDLSIGDFGNQDLGVLVTEGSFPAIKPILFSKLMA